MADSPIDWFVAPDSKDGDGSREKPFHDPWLAFRSAGPGDFIHIAAGNYFGRYDRSSWIVESPNLTIRGGYSRDFGTRSPWKTPSVFAAYPGYEVSRENNVITGHTDHSGLTLDGLTFDCAGRNRYDVKPIEGLRDHPNMDGPIAAFNAKNVTIKNCIFANGTSGAVQLSGDGSRFENNLVINILGIGMLELRSAPGGERQLITVSNNSFCFAFDTAGPPFGKGADNAIGIRLNCPAVIQNNVFVACGNAGIRTYGDSDGVSVDGNLFFITPHDVLTAFIQGAIADITEANLDEMEDLGLKSSAGNVVQDPGLKGLRPEWVDTYTRHLLANYAKPPREAANALRASVGLPALSTPADTEKQAGDLAPRLYPEDMLAISVACKQGAHPMDLPTPFTGHAQEPTPTYQSINWNAMTQPDPSLAGKRVELRVGLGFEQNSGIIDGLTPETHMGIRVYPPFSDDGAIYVLAKRYALVNRQFEEAVKCTNGREAESTYFLRGIYRTDVAPQSRQKVTLIVESIVLAPLILAKDFAPRPQGRDWFVRAGSSGGDGTKEKPFRDPFQALDKAEGGDAIHVAGGDYFGKLHSGQWKILVRYLSLLGGYSADFAERDPWKNPTRFLMGEDEKAKGTRRGKILDSEENSEGLILDGFIFDGASYNAYAKNGGLDLAISPTDTLVSLRGAQAPITVRNCLFLNTAAEAVSVSCAYGLFENNVLLNSSGWLLKVNAGGSGPWTIRNNTFLFAEDPTPRAGTGKSSPDGTLLLMTGRSAMSVESNIFAFGDNYGVRSAISPQNVSFTNNVFAANLFNHLTDEKYVWADGSNWDRRAVADSEFAAFKGNSLDLPKLPVDSGFADVALARLFSLPSRISADQWKQFAEKIGSAAKPPVPAAPVAEAPKLVEPVKPAAGASLADLIASLGKTAAPKPDTTTAAPAADDAGPVYCPAFDWKKAIALAQDSSVGGPGAHRVPISVSFSAAAPKADIQYTQVTPEQLGGDLSVWDNKPIEVDVKEARESSTNPSLYPPPMTKDDYCAYYASLPSDTIRTKISIVVRLDTSIAKALFRTTPNDVLRIRGTARVLYPGALAVVADAIEAAQQAPQGV